MPPLHRNATAVAAFVTLVALVVPCVGCDATSKSADTTTTGATSTTGDEGTATSAGAAAARGSDTAVESDTSGSSGTSQPSETSVPKVGVADVRKALDQHDVCALYHRMESMTFDQSEPKKFAEQLTEFASVMDDAIDMIDASLHDDWVLLADGAREMASQLRAHPDDRKKAAAILSRPEMDRASAHLDEWMDEHCA